PASTGLTSRLSLARYEYTGTRRLLAQRQEAASVAVDDPAILYDQRDLGWALQNGDVGYRIAGPDDDVRGFPGGDHAKLAVAVQQPSVAARIRDDRLHRRHADFSNEQLGLLAMPPPMSEGRSVARVTAAEDWDAAVARIADHLERGIELRPQAITHPLAQTSSGGAVLYPDPGRGQDRCDRNPRFGHDVEI